MNILKDQRREPENVSIITYQMEIQNFQEDIVQQDNIVTLLTDAEQQMKEAQQQLKKEKQASYIGQFVENKVQQQQQQQPNQQNQQQQQESQPDQPDQPPNENENNNEEDDSQEKPSWFARIGKSAAFGTFASLTSVCAAKVGLIAAGFSSVGPVAGSLAAAAQASIGNVAAGSAFAIAQSVAMTGAAPFIIPGAVIAAGAGGVYYWYNRNNENTENVENNQDQDQTTENSQFNPQNNSDYEPLITEYKP